MIIFSTIRLAIVEKLYNGLEQLDVGAVRTQRCDFRIMVLSYVELQLHATAAGDACRFPVLRKA